MPIVHASRRPPKATRPIPRPEHGFSLIVVGLVVIGFWVPWLFSGFWLDETGTAWVVSDGIGDAIERSRFQGQSPLFYVIAWAARQLGGTSEVALRLPSLIGMGIATFLVARLGRLLVDTRMGLIAATAFAVGGGITFAAADARPYALASATLLGSTVAFVHWLDGRGNRWGVGWVVLAAATISLSYTFMLAFVAHGAMLASHPSRRRLIRPVSIGVLSIGLLLTPSIPHLMAILRQPDILTFGAEGVPVRRFLFTLIPPALFVALWLGVVLARLGGPIELSVPTVARHRLFLILTWMAAPTLILFALSWQLTPKFFQARYLLSSAAGTALSFAWLTRSLSPRRTQGLVVVLLVIISAFTLDGSSPRRQDWKEAAAVTDRLVQGPSTPVLLHTGFASARPATGDPGSGLVIAPAIVYDIPGSIHHLPYQPDLDQLDELGRFASQNLAQHRRFVLIVSFKAWPYQIWLADQLSSDGFAVSHEYRSLHLDVYLFERSV